MTQTKQEKRAHDTRRRKAAYDLLKDLAQRCGVMQHSRDGHGYDEFIGLIESGDFKLEFVESESSSS